MSKSRKPVKVTRTAAAREPNRPGNVPKVLPLVTDPTPNPDNASRYRGETKTNTPTGNGFGKKPEGRP